MTSKPEATREALALLVLRLGCAWFIFVWAAHKFLATQQYIGLARHFDKVELDPLQVQLIGGAQILVCLLVAVGWQRTWSYAALAAIHGFTIWRIVGRLFDPFAVNENGFPINRNSTVALAVFLAMAALWLLRHRDRWSLDAYLADRRAKAAPTAPSG